MTAACERLGGWLQWLCLFLALLFAEWFVAIALLSIRYPFNLEWMEGQVIDVVQRVRDGLPVYTEPSLEYVPFIYTPFYFYAAAIVSWFTGVGYVAARLVSLLSALGCGALIYAWIRKENGSWKVASITAGLFFATYKLSGRWFDIGRVDSFFLCLTLGGLFMLYHYRSRRMACMAAVLLTAAFFTKQAAFLVTLPALAGMYFVDRRHTLKVGLLWAVILAVGIAAYNWASDGWFDFFVFVVPAGHAIERGVILHFWTGSLWSHVPVLVVLSLAVIGYYFYLKQRKWIAYAGLAAGGIGASYASLLHSGGVTNVLMPAHAVLALLTGLCLVGLANIRNAWIKPAAYLLVAVQMVRMLYNPIPFIPTQEAVARGNQFLAQLAQVKGDVFMPELQFVPTLAGKKSYTYGYPAFDVMRSRLRERNYIKGKMRQEMHQALATHRFAAIIPGTFLIPPGVDRFYRFDRHLNSPGRSVTGAMQRLWMDLYIPKEESQ